MVNSQAHFASESSLTDLETEATSETGIPQAPHREPSVSSIVPGTPRADSPQSHRSPDHVPESRRRLPQAESHPRALPHGAISLIGTPSAVDAIRKPSMLAQFVTPAARGPLSTHQGLLKDISWATPEGGVDQTDSDFDEVDARLVLEAARTRRTVCRLEHELAEARCAESISLVKLYRHRAEDAKKRQDYAEFDLGRARETVSSNSRVSDFSVARRPNAKRPRLSSPSESQSSNVNMISAEV